VGDFKNNGREWRREGTPELVKVHDFIDPKLSRAIPYGIYDITNNVGGSASVRTTIPPASRSMQSAGGGARWGESAILRPND
jgi:hypothetical protein